ncbi:MAG TPA: divalent-cation tolerance protein CutA [Burkholderiales bacterium]|jgi:periplasmic divalent cation tolerance protein|nr:divalent-cation tolerance protein CutA [Burkholderiales bacterium]
MNANQDSRYIIVLTNVPDQESAIALAQHLLECKLAACVNILSPCLSMYHWRKKIETANETPMLIKSLSVNFAEIEKAIKEKHPYDVPEIIALPITQGSAEYLAWIDAEN